uniref:ORF5 protein n=1 Tax=Pika coronavirus TaxID=3027598 RepID=A0AAT9T5Y6_9NIDO|nr:MAG: ORF5 protein [Pika coronavirus]
MILFILFMVFPLSLCWTVRPCIHALYDTKYKIQHHFDKTPGTYYVTWSIVVNDTDVHNPSSVMIASWNPLNKASRKVTNFACADSVGNLVVKLYPGVKHSYLLHGKKFYQGNVTVLNERYDFCLLNPLPKPYLVVDYLKCPQWPWLEGEFNATCYADFVGKRYTYWFRPYHRIPPTVMSVGNATIHYRGGFIHQWFICGASHPLDFRTVEFLPLQYCVDHGDKIVN